MLFIMLFIEVILAHILSFTAILVEGIDFTIDASIEPDKNVSAYSPILAIVMYIMPQVVV